MFRDRVGYGSGVPSMEMLLGASVIALLGGQYLLFSKIKQLFVNLDLQLAATIGKLLEEMPFEGMDPVTPIQQWLMQAAMDSIQPPRWR